MKVVFGKRLRTAVLLSPVLPNSIQTESCLQIQYRLSDTKVMLRIDTIGSSITSSTTLANITYNNQTNASDWNTASITLNNPLGQLMFVAKKIGYSANISYVAIRRLEIRNISCHASGRSFRRHLQIISFNL